MQELIVCFQCGPTAGHPYGHLASETNQKVLDLMMDAINPDISPVRSLVSCKDPDRSNPGCADLDLQVGSTELSFSTGRPMGYNTVTTDVTTENGLDMYPFDEYTAKGIVRVSSCCSKQAPRCAKALHACLGTCCADGPAGLAHSLNLLDASSERVLSTSTNMRCCHPPTCSRLSTAAHARCCRASASLRRTSA